MLNELKDMWNASSKVDVLAFAVITVIGIAGYGVTAAGVAVCMFVYHAYLAYNNANK